MVEATCRTSHGSSWLDRHEHPDLLDSLSSALWPIALGLLERSRPGPRPLLQTPVNMTALGPGDQGSVLKSKFSVKHHILKS